MPAEVLVMCARCGRPGPATHLTCAGCGAELPDAPFLEGTVSSRRRLLLSARQLHWCKGQKVEGVAELANLRQVRLQVRPVWEALLLALLLSVLSIASPWPLVQLPLALLASLAALACLAQRRFLLILEEQSGRRAVPLGIGFPGSPLARRVASIWESFAAELSRRGLRTG